MFFILYDMFVFFIYFKLYYLFMYLYVLICEYFKLFLVLFGIGMLLDIVDYNFEKYFEII